MVSTEPISEEQPSKALNMMQAQKAVERINTTEGENEPSIKVKLFVFTEKSILLHVDLREMMMDHLRTVSYIVDKRVVTACVEGGEYHGISGAPANY